MPSLRITNLTQFEVQLKTTVKNISNNVFEALAADAKKLFQGIPDNVQASAEFQELATDEELRGKLGMPNEANKLGSDTDASDLILMLRQFKTVKHKSTANYRLEFKFPSLVEFEDGLIRSLSRFRSGRIQPGPHQSWFKWWEFGDKGEITTLTVSQRNIDALLGRLKNPGSNDRARLLNILRKGSRSGFAMQAIEQEADGNSKIIGRGLIGRTYQNYIRIFPARMGKTLKKLVLATGGRAEKLAIRRIVK
jgi:hypothetical protein